MQFYLPLVSESRFRVDELRFFPASGKMWVSPKQMEFEFSRWNLVFIKANCSLFIQSRGEQMMILDFGF